MLSMELLSELDFMFDVDSDDVLSHSTVSAAVAQPTSNMDAIPTDDIWNKFDFGIETSEEDDGIFEPSSNISSSSFELYWAPKEQFKEIRHHDCMWAGLCGSKDHKNADSCILAYEGTKPAPLHSNSSSESVSSSSSSSPCKSPTKISEPAVTITTAESNISRTTLTNGTQITTVFKNSRTNSASPAKSDKTAIVSGGNIVKVSIVDKKSTASLSSLKHLCTSSDSLSNDSQDLVHLMPLSEVTGQITRTLSTIELNPPVVDFDCANRDHNYGMVPPPKLIADMKREPIDIKQECSMTSDDDDETYDSRDTSGTVYMSPSSNGCSPGSKFDYGVQQVMSKYIKTEDLGVQTPSDSDEEVDVVSLYDADMSESFQKPPSLITPPQSVLTSRSTTPNYHQSASKLMGGGGRTEVSARSAAKRLIKSTLPTNPYDNLTSYEELQRNVAKVIKKSTNSRKKGGRKSAKKKSKKSSGSGGGGGYPSKGQLKAAYRQSGQTFASASGKARQYEEYKKQYLAEVKAAGGGSGGGGKKKKQYRIDLLPEKRKFHNNMERKRRVDLRNLFEELRELIPTLANKKRAPKVQILNEAESLCNELSYKSKMQSKQAEELRREQARLRNAVAPLRHLFYEKNVSSYMGH